MKRFIGIRRNPPADYIEKGYTNGPDRPDYEGVVFSDGTTVVRWLVQPNTSHSVWSKFEHFEAIHGHSEYGSIIEWMDQE